MTNQSFAQTMFDKFAYNSRIAGPVKHQNIRDILFADYLICWQNMTYEVHWRSQYLKSGSFADMIKYVIGHWNREAMNEFIDECYQSELDYEDPDPYRVVEERAIAQAYEKLVSTGE